MLHLTAANDLLQTFFKQKVWIIPTSEPKDKDRQKTPYFQ